jgi:hypothetical protein
MGRKVLPSEPLDTYGLRAGNGDTPSRTFHCGKRIHGPLMKKVCLGSRPGSAGRISQGESGLALPYL